LSAYPWFLARVCVRGGIQEWHGARQVLSRDPALPCCSEPHSFDAAVRRIANQHLVADGWRVWQDSPVDDLLVEDFRATQISEPILRPKGIKREVYSIARKHALDKFKVRVSDATIRRCHDLMKESPLPQAQYAPSGSEGTRRHKRADGEQVAHLDDRGLTEQRAQHPWWQVREMLSRGQIDEIEFAHAIELGEIFYDRYQAPQSMQFGDEHSPRHDNDKHKMLVQVRGGDIRWDDGCRRGRARIEEEDGFRLRFPGDGSLHKIFQLSDQHLVPEPIEDEGGNAVIEGRPVMPHCWSSICCEALDRAYQWRVYPHRDLDVLLAQLAPCFHGITMCPQGHHTLPLKTAEPVYMRTGGSPFIQPDDNWLEPNRDMARVILRIGYRSARLLERTIHQGVECNPILIKDALGRYTWRGPADGCELLDKSWIRAALQRYARQEVPAPVGVLSQLL
jgi:hypothetical protein